jgi:hypothetical protein
MANKDPARNAAQQAAYRERRQAYIDQLERDNAALRAEVAALKARLNPPPRPLPPHVPRRILDGRL